MNERFGKLLKNPSFVCGSLMVLSVLLLLVAGILHLPHDPFEISVGNKLAFFSSEHPLGTDDLGRDILSRLMLGARSSFLIGALVVSFGLLVGGTIGALSGYLGGWCDLIFKKLIDVQMSFPGILLALMLISVFGTDFWVTVLALGLLSIPRFARITRSGFLRLRHAEFVKAARVRGAGKLHIMTRHILPNLMPELITTCSLSFASAIMSEAGLSYLGLGSSPMIPSFGKMLSEAQNVMFQAPWYVLIPATTITLLVMGSNLIADGLGQCSRREENV